jgi:hypothetical protein
LPPVPVPQFRPLSLWDEFLIVMAKEERKILVNALSL